MVGSLRASKQDVVFCMASVLAVKEGQEVLVFGGKTLTLRLFLTAPTMFWLLF